MQRRRCAAVRRSAGAGRSHHQSDLSGPPAHLVYPRAVDVLSIIGWGGSALVVASLLQARILRLRVLNLIGCVILVGFNLAIGVWPMVGMNAVLAVINVVHLWRLLPHRHDETAYQVLGVDKTDAYLGYVLDQHAKDTTPVQPRFHPGAS